jgi:hypothetical protein
LNIINAAHPLAAGLQGTVTVTGAPSTLSWGKPNANAVRIATLTGDATKAVVYGYEKGAAMVGLTAPGRRVAVFMADSTAANWNANGRKLFDAAVQWATSK